MPPSFPYKFFEQRPGLLSSTRDEVRAKLPRGRRLTLAEAQSFIAAAVPATGPLPTMTPGILPGPKGDKGDPGDPGAPGVGVVQAGGTAFAVPAGAWNRQAEGGAAGGARQTTGFMIALAIRVGVIAGPNENGHIYLDIAPNNNGGALPTTGWITACGTGSRANVAAGTGGVAPVSDAGNDAPAEGTWGAMTTLQTFVANGWWYRLRTFVVSPWGAPQFVSDGATPGFFQTLT